MSTAALLFALEKIAKVAPHPDPGTDRLRIINWADALDETQRIARRALDDWQDE